MTRKLTTFDVVNNSLLVLLAFFCVYPFLNILSVSLSDGVEVMSGRVFLYPRGFNLETYAYIFGNPKLGIVRGVLNSFLYTGLGTLVAVLATYMTGFALSKKRLPGRYFIMMMFLFTMVFEGGLIPSYLVNKSLGLVNSMWVMIIPGAISVFLLIVTRTFLEEIPPELEETSFIDGANDWVILWKVFLPLSTPVLATIGIFYAINNWNSFLTPMIYLQDSKMYPIQLILYNLVIKPDAGTTHLETLTVDGVSLLPRNIEAAVIVLAIIPIVLIYPFAQRYFTKGLLVGSVKG